MSSRGMGEPRSCCQPPESACPLTCILMRSASSSSPPEGGISLLNCILKMIRLSVSVSRPHFSPDDSVIPLTVSIQSVGGLLGINLESRSSSSSSMAFALHGKTLRPKATNHCTHRPHRLSTVACKAMSQREARATYQNTDNLTLRILSLIRVFSTQQREQAIRTK